MAEHELTPRPTAECPECGQDHHGLTPWHTITPADAVSINLTERPDIDGPRNENGEACPWPWEPQQLVGAPLGQFHCGYCWAMCVAGMSHLDYRDGRNERHAASEAEEDDVDPVVGGPR